jgi:hypothetical protein
MVVSKTIAQERINFTREINEQIGIRKELNMINSENWQNAKRSKGERKEQMVFQSIRKNISGISKYLSIITFTFQCKWSSPMKR